MKAYIVSDRQGACDYSTIIFAETREQARVIAQRSDALEWYDLRYIDIWARRVPALDKYYRGYSEMDWDNADDRIAMVKDGNFSCSDEYLEYEDCVTCPAKQWCDRYEDVSYENMVR